MLLGWELPARALWWLPLWKGGLTNTKTSTLKDSNIYVEYYSAGQHKYRAKVLDFGLSRLLTQHARPLGGTLRWMALEVTFQRNRSPDLAADVFSFGRLGHFIITGIPHSDGMSEKRILRKMKKTQSPLLHWPRTDALTQRYQSIVEQCIQPHAVLRPTMQHMSHIVDGFAEHVVCM